MPSNSRNLRHGSVVLKDGDTPVNTLPLAIEEGDLSFTESKPGVAVKHRGGLDHWSKGEEIEVPVSFTIKFVEYVQKTGATVGVPSTISPRDFLMGAHADLVTTSGRNDAFTLTVEFTIANPALSGDQTEVLTFTKFKAESVEFSEGAEYNTLRVSGRALLTNPTGARS
jgi:hypothetical protein